MEDILCIPQSIYYTIYILFFLYIKMCSSYILCSFTRVTHFLDIVIRSKSENTHGNVIIVPQKLVI